MGQYFIYQQGSTFCYTTRPAAGTEAATFTSEGDQVLSMAGVAFDSQKTMLKAILCKKQLNWVAAPNRTSTGLNIVFGHESTLDKVKLPGGYPTDSGCLRGDALTALRLGGARSFRLPCIT